MPTSGIMISGRTVLPFFCTSMAASMIARTCMSPISGNLIGRRQPRRPSIGLASWSSSTRRLTFSTGMPSWRATSAWPASSCGRNSCSGGSSRRIVTGRPSIASKMPMKSCFWNGSSSARAFFRPASSSARIIFRMATIRWSSKNMCSVRHRPIPSAPNERALTASSGVSALVRTLSVRTLSAHDMSVGEVAGDRGIDGRHLADHDVAGRAVDRDEVADLDDLAVDSDLALRLVDRDRLAADDARLAPAAGDDRRVAGLAAGGREDALGQVHAGHVLGAGLLAHQQDRVVGVLLMDARRRPRPRG